MHSRQLPRRLWDMYRLALDWQPKRTLARQLIARMEPDGELRAVIPARYSSRVRGWSNFLRTRVVHTNPHYKNRWSSRSVSLHPGLVPARGPFGVIKSCDRGTWSEEELRPTYQLGTSFVSYLVDRTENAAIGFVTFGICMDVNPTRHALEPELVVYAVWIDPMFRGQGLSPLLVHAVREGAEKFFDGIVTPRGQPEIKLVVAGDVESLSGGKFIQDCADEIEACWIYEQMHPGLWYFTEVETDLR